MNNAVTAGQLIVAAFSLARSQYPEINKRWITASYRMGGLLSDATLIVALQQAGELDLLCRSLELEMEALVKDSRGNTVSDQLDLRPNYLSMLSSQWVSLAYATHFALHSRKFLPAVADTLFDHLRILRVQLEKHEIADPKERKQRNREPIEMVRMPAKPEDTPFIYNPQNNNRAHITPSGLSKRGSFSWLLIKIDKDNQESIWVERQGLADQMLSIWENFTRPTS